MADSEMSEMSSFIPHESYVCNSLATKMGVVNSSESVLGTPKGEIHCLSNLEDSSDILSLETTFQTSDQYSSHSADYIHHSFIVAPILGSSFQMFKLYFKTPQTNLSTLCRKDFFLCDNEKD